MTQASQTAPVAARPAKWKIALNVLGRAAANFAEDRGTQLAASISYYTLFSLFPLTLLAVSIFGIVLRDDAVRLRVLRGIINYLPIEGSTVAESLQQAAELGPTVTVVSFLGALWTAAALSAAIRMALNQVFETKRRRPLARAKFVDFTLLPIIGVPLLGGIALTAVWRFFQAQTVERLGFVADEVSWVWDVGALGIPLVMSFVAFAVLYRYAPNVHHPWRYILPGAVFAAVAFELLKGGFTFYLQYVANYSVYGSLGSVIVLLFWVYLTANILIFGGEVAAELPHVLNREPRHGVRPDEGDWRHSLLGFVKGLFMVQDDEETAPDEVPPEEGEGQGDRARDSAAG